MRYQIYRTTAIGESLIETLDDYVSRDLMPSSTAAEIIKLFDAAVSERLKSVGPRRHSVRGSSFVHRLVDNVWTVVIRGAEYRDCEEEERLETVKIVACRAQPAPDDP